MSLDFPFFQKGSFVLSGRQKRTITVVINAGIIAVLFGFLQADTPLLSSFPSVTLQAVLGALLVLTSVWVWDNQKGL